MRRPVSRRDATLQVSTRSKCGGLGKKNDRRMRRHWHDYCRIDPKFAVSG
jgi:hypothetical protein